MKTTQVQQKQHHKGRDRDIFLEATY